ncbi:hypothetical protein [Mariprofundus sp. KV]|uniref:hypothetical protein n=1 Tax=Mariprofundus sp. KV TaxID=2608715 RepID=UPI0015A0D89F|nr:hypothetical protein [Mariprofundus sp. KV]NWF36179.1 hypothetical protein [Mariprofundus sp. KV]
MKMLFKGLNTLLFLLLIPMTSGAEESMSIQQACDQLPEEYHSLCSAWDGRGKEVFNMPERAKTISQQCAEIIPEIFEQDVEFYGSAKNSAGSYRTSPQNLEVVNYVINEAGRMDGEVSMSRWFEFFMENDQTHGWIKDKGGFSNSYQTYLVSKIADDLSPEDGVVHISNTMHLCELFAAWNFRNAILGK